MPIAVSYPGVYIDEVSSGVRTITGVATSIAAFVGRALRGVVNVPVTINSYGDFERLFGGLWVGSSLGYALRDFFLNGGGQAIVVRLYHVSDPARSSASFDANGLQLTARTPGAWGNQLRARIDHDIVPPDPDRFNLTVRDGATRQLEVFRNLSWKEADARYVGAVLANESGLVTAAKPGALPTAHADLDPAASPPRLDLWADNTPATSSRVTVLAIDGGTLGVNDFTGPGKFDQKEGLYALRKADLFNLLCLPPYTDAGGDLLVGDVEAALVAEAAVFCEQRRAMLLVDPPSAWKRAGDAVKGAADVGTNSKNAALFFPRLREPNPLRDNQVDELAPCGALAGVFARTDTQRGVWKAPAGLDATLVGVPALSVPLTDAENGQLNPLGINCLRAMPAAGRIVWGARTLQGDDRLASEWKYVPVRRTALFIEESLYRGTQWVVFEPNDEPLWAQIRLNVGAFMQNLFRQGAFQGKTPQEAYFVKCDKETTTQDDINRGIVNIAVGFAPLKPAEFVVIKLQQIAGQVQA
jgi:phage tail sheath protein FI